MMRKGGALQMLNEYISIVNVNEYNVLNANKDIS